MLQSLGLEDYRAVFQALPAPCLLLDPDLRIVDANSAYLRELGRGRHELVGRPVFEAFPEGPQGPSGAILATSMRAALASGLPDELTLLKYDVEVEAASGAWEERWWHIVNAPVVHPDGSVAGLLNTVRDMTAIVQERNRSETALSLVSEAELTISRRLAGLVEVGIELASARTVADLVEAVVGHGLSALGADGGAVGVCDYDQGTIRLTTTESLGMHTQLDYGSLPLDGPLPAAVAARTGEPVLLGDQEAGLAFSPAMAAVYAEVGRAAWAALPLTVGGRVLGSITIGWEGSQQFTVADVDLMQAFAAQCAQALDRLLAQERERESAAATARFAEALQRSLLTDPIQPDHLQIAVRYQPAGQEAQVGGDWYDAFLTRDGATSLVVGDVSGHDRDAAASMAQVRNVLRGIGHALVEPPAAVLTSLDQAMQNLDVRGLATAILAHVEVDADRGADEDTARILRWSNAGHPPPLLVHSDGTTEMLLRPTDLLLGLDATTERSDHVHPLPPGVTVLLFTDGLVERRDSDIDQGLQRLGTSASRLRELPLEDLCDALLGELAADAEDDVVLLAVRAYPSAQARPREAGPEQLPEDVVVDQA